MSANIEKAIGALSAELDHAKQGLSHYQGIVHNLENALAKLGIIGSVSQSAGQVGSDTGKSKRGRKSKSVADLAQGKQAGKQRNDKLPFTGGTFWVDLISDQPQSGADVLTKAIGKLGLNPTPEQRKKLVNRMTFALNDLVKTGKIKDSGRGRERRFFKN
jgi:hypothetical protein